MKYESMPSGSEEQSNSQEQMEIVFHVMSAEDIFGLLKKDQRYYSLRGNEAALRDKADIIQKIMDKMPHDKDFAHLTPLGMYAYAAASEGVLPEENTSHSTWN